MDGPEPSGKPGSPLLGNPHPMLSHRSGLPSGDRPTMTVSCHLTNPRAQGRLAWGSSHENGMGRGDVDFGGGVAGLSGDGAGDTETDTYRSGGEFHRWQRHGVRDTGLGRHFDSRPL